MKLSRGEVVGPGGRVGQFWTPTHTAKHFVEWAGIRAGTRVLDCGAGMGALSMAALDRHARVTSVEVDERLVARVRPQLERRGATVVQQDFLAAANPRRQPSFDHVGHAFDVATSNPPWERDLPERFIEAMLERAPRAAVIVPINVLTGVERSKLWRRVAVMRVQFLPRRPNFGGPGSGKRDVIFLELASRNLPRAPGEMDFASIGVGE